MPKRTLTSGLVSKALQAASPSVDELVEESGFSRDTLYSWTSGRRTPSAKNLQQFGRALQRRGGDLVEIGQQIERLAEELGEEK